LRDFHYLPTSIRRDDDLPGDEIIRPDCYRITGLEEQIDWRSNPEPTLLDITVVRIFERYIFSIERMSFVAAQRDRLTPRSLIRSNLFEVNSD
jgi:hypothetical protein